MRLTVKLRPPNALARAWYRRTGETVAACSFDWFGDIARLVPYRFRRFHQIVAAVGGYFWLLCPLCAEPFGGHESGKSIPDPTDTEQQIWLSVCSECSRRQP